MAFENPNTWFKNYEKSYSILNGRAYFREPFSVKTTLSTASYSWGWGRQQKKSPQGPEEGRAEGLTDGRPPWARAARERWLSLVPALPSSRLPSERFPQINSYLTEKVPSNSNYHLKSDSFCLALSHLCSQSLCAQLRHAIKSSDIYQIIFLLKIV